MGFRFEKSSIVSLLMTTGSKGFCLKSKQSSISLLSQSLSVRQVSVNLFSISFRGEVKSKMLWHTAPGVQVQHLLEKVLV